MAKPNGHGYRAVATKWSSGNLVCEDASGNEIFTVDATNRKLSVPAGSTVGPVSAASLATLADSDLTPGPAVCLQFTVADHATQNVDFVIASKMIVDDVLVVSTGAQGANANTVQLDNGITGNHITDAMSLNGKVDGDVVRCASLFDANLTIAAGATLRIIQTKAGGTMSFIAKIRGHLSA